ncbi:hypothetical protein V2A60_003899 [Cordyceps javanica]
MTTRPNKSDSTRQKQWAPKVRTGCQTCRARRIKCDETQPHCTKCVKRGLSCQYTLRFRPVARDRPLAPAPTQAQAPLAQAEPPMWHFMEAIRYYCAFVRPIRVAQEGTHDIPDPPFHTGDVISARFICQIIGHQALTLSRRRGSAISFWEERQFASMRRNYSRYFIEFLNIVNSCLRSGISGGGTAKAFHHLWILLSFDLSLKEKLWPVHVSGALAYAQLLGGPKAALSLPGPPIFFRQMVLQAIVSNATSPVAQQIKGHGGYTDEEIKTVLTDEESTRPFPVDLVVVVKHITDIRVQATFQTGNLRALQHRMQLVLQRIDMFDPDAWAKELEYYSEDATSAIGQIFQIATRLYGILALPVSVTAPALAAAYPGVASASGPGSAYDSLRVSQRTQLVECLRDTWPLMPQISNMSWPLLVAGVALADGSWEDRDFVADCMDRIWKQPMGDISPLMGLEKLQQFWKSGKRGWEDCFDEPVPR